MKTTLALLLILHFPFAILHSQNVGIGTTSPKALLHVADSSVVFSAQGDTPSIKHDVPIKGTGRRMLWYADKGAFRVGYISGNNWNKDSIGAYSIAGGYDSYASGSGAVAMGNFNSAIGDLATVFGGGNIALGKAAFATGGAVTANGTYSFAAGLYNHADGYCAVALGQANSATGQFSTALGQVTSASGTASTAMGASTSAEGLASTAIGLACTASGDYSVAMGRRVSINGKAGAFFFGDSDPHNKGVRPIGFADQIAMRFNGGYYFISSDAGGDIGVRVTAGGNAWSSISDVRRKENFVPVNGEAFLQKIATLSLTTWNYKGQDVKTFRHYGPMAHDFFSAFGKDALGTIGCDTLINQQDFLGVNLIAIQALEKRTTELTRENARLSTAEGKLEMENGDLREKVSDLKARLQKLEALLAWK